MAERRSRDVLIWSATIAAMALVLLAPALWNGFPLIYPDTGGYLERPLLGTLEMGRSAVYGAFLLAGAPLNFWPSITVQALVLAWLIVLVLRAHGLARPALALGIVVVLALTTSLPWFASQLMPDLFFPAAVLAIYLLVFHATTLCTAERVTLVVLIIFAVTSHMALLGVAIGLVLALFLLRSFPIIRVPLPAVGLPALALALGVLVAPLSNLAITGKFAFTPGGASFFFNRLVEDGIITRYLDKTCPDPTLRICAYRADISTGYDDWLWKNDTPFWKLGGWQGYSDEQRHIILATLLSDPLAHLTTALRATLLQLVSFKTEVAFLAGENAYTISTVREHLPALYPALMAARQQAAPFNVAPLNIVHIPVAALSILALIAVLIGRRRFTERAIAFAATVLFALIINAAVCGVFSHAADRYQSRLVPIAPLAVLVIALASRKRENTR
jgi:hypothetical protein